MGILRKIFGKTKLTSTNQSPTNVAATKDLLEPERSITVQGPFIEDIPQAKAMQSADLLEKCQEKLREGDFDGAIALVKDARSIPGNERSTICMDAQAAVSLKCQKAHLRDAWASKPLSGHRCTPKVSISSDDRVVVSADGTLRIWDLKTGECMKTLKTSELTFVAEITSDGKRVVAGYMDNRLRLWDIASGNCVRILEGHTTMIHDVAISPNSMVGASAAGDIKTRSDYTARLWDLESGRCLHVLEGHTHVVQTIAFSLDGNRFLSGSRDGTIRVWDISTGDCLQILGGKADFPFHHYPPDVESACFSYDGCHILAGLSDGSVYLWETKTGRLEKKLQGHSDYVYSVCFSVDGHWAVSGSRDTTVRLWDIPSGKCICTFQEHKDSVYSVCMSLNNRWILSGGADNALLRWELDWEIVTPKQKESDNAVLPHLKNFLHLHSPSSDNGTSWDSKELDQLMYILGCSGLGNLGIERVKAKLDIIVSDFSVEKPEAVDIKGQQWKDIRDEPGVLLSISDWKKILGQLKKFRHTEIDLKTQLLITACHVLLKQQLREGIGDPRRIKFDDKFATALAVIISNVFQMLDDGCEEKKAFARLIVALDAERGR